MLKFSVSTIENFRYIRNIEDVNKREQAVEEFILGLSMKVPPTEAMEKGSAIDSIICAPLKHLDANGDYTSKGYTFPRTTVHNICSNIDYQGIFQIPCFKTYQVGAEQVQVSGRADYFIGNKVIDFKAKFRDKPLTAFDCDSIFEQYEKSLQWKFYLDMLGMTFFEFRVMVFDNDTNHLIDGTHVELQEYAGMQLELQEGLRDICQFIEAYQLEDVFTSKDSRLHSNSY